MDQTPIGKVCIDFITYNLSCWFANRKFCDRLLERGKRTQCLGRRVDNFFGDRRPWAFEAIRQMVGRVEGLNTR